MPDAACVEYKEIWRASMSWFGRLRKKEKTLPQAQFETPAPAPVAVPAPPTTLEFDIPASDPLLEFILGNSGVIDVDQLKMDSPTLKQLKEAGVRLVVPLISQG